MNSAIDTEITIEGDPSSILDTHGADREFVLEIRNHREEWPDDMDDVVIEKASPHPSDVTYPPQERQRTVSPGALMAGFKSEWDQVSSAPFMLS